MASSSRLGYPEDRHSCEAAAARLTTGEIRAKMTTHTDI